MNRCSMARGVAATAVGIAVATTLHAQSQPVGIEEVIVTAQKRAESAQEIPIAIDVITGEAFIREGIRDVKDIGKMSTELEINTSIGQATIIGMRSLQQTIYAPTNETLTSVHMNGLFLGGFFGMNAIMHDLERVEVLAGPQGTLYGRNAVAGAVNLITKLPGKDFEGNASVEGGSDSLLRIAAGVSVPVSDTFSMRVAGTKLTRDSFFTTGNGEQDWWSGRLTGVWTPSDTDKLTILADYSRFNGTNDAPTLLAVNANALANGVVPASVTNFLGSPTLQDPYNNAPYRDQRNQVNFMDNEQKMYGTSLEYSHDFGSVSSVFLYGHRKVEGFARGPEKFAANAFGTFSPAVQDSDTAELRFLSNDSDRFEWVAGLFWYKVQSKGAQYTPVSNNSPDPSSGLDIPWCPCTGNFAVYPNNGDGKSYAAFTQGTWTPEANDKLHLTLGLRYSYDWKSGALGFAVAGVPVTAFGLVDFPAAVRPLFNGLNDLAPGGDNTNSWTKTTWRVGLDYDIAKSVLLYGSISTGYKSGAYTFGSTPALNPENLLAYEIGIKSQSLNNTLQVNASAWWYDYTDIEAQVTRLLPPQYWVVVFGNPVTASGSSANVGAADVAGVSADVDWLATDNDRFGLSFTYTYSKITDGKEIGNPSVVLFNEGERLGDSPKWQVLGRYSHAFHLSNGAKLDPQIKYQWQSQKYNRGLRRPEAFYAAYDFRSPPQEAIPSHGILDFSARYSPASDRWGVTGYVNNLTDELNILTQVYNANPAAGAAGTYGHTTGLIGEPRTYGLILDVKF